MAQQQALDPLRIFHASVLAVLLDDGLTVPTETAKWTLTLAKCLVGLLGNEQHVQEHAIFFSSVVDKIMKVTWMKKSIIKEKIFQDLYKLRISGKFILLWQNYLEAIGLDVDPLCYQQVLQEIFESLLIQK